MEICKPNRNLGLETHAGVVGNGRADVLIWAAEVRAKLIIVSRLD